jgi:hypothetical protein
VQRRRTCVKVRLHALQRQSCTISSFLFRVPQLSGCDRRSEGSRPAACSSGGFVRRAGWDQPYRASCLLKKSPRQLEAARVTDIGWHESRVRGIERCSRLGRLQYELAKQLEQAGFPQAGTGTWIGDPDMLIWRSRVYVPTLDELIEACGAEFAELRHAPHEADGTWMASGSNPHRNCYGASHAEAVARLWLTLRQL